MNPMSERGREQNNPRRLVYTWCIHGVYMVYTWCRLYMVYTWCVHGVYVTLGRESEGAIVKYSTVALPLITRQTWWLD